MGAMKHALLGPIALAPVALVLAAPAPAQTPDSHAPSGEFRQPTPADRFRQVASRDNLQHPPGYVPAEPGTFGEVVRLGSGTTDVILLAGLGPGWRVFDAFVAAIESEARIHAVTLAGYGGSSAPPMPESGTSFAEGTWLAGARTALARLIDGRELERPVIVAFYSDAARIAIRYALEEPEQVGGLLVLSASARFPLPPETPRGAALDGFADSWFKTVTEIMWPSGMWPATTYANDPALSEKTWWDVLQPSLPTAIRYTVETWADDLVPDLPALDVPLLVLSPGFDAELLGSPTGAMLQQRFHAGWDQALAAGAAFEHRRVPDARLLLWEDRPQAVEDALWEVAAQR